MVTIVNHRVGVNQTTQEEFIMLELQGSPVMVQSKDTGRMYLTARKCSISTTFTKEYAQNLLGTQMPGNIEKVPCEEYEYTIEETGEVITLSHRWEYSPDEAPKESSTDSAIKELLEQPVNDNGLVPSF